MTKVHEWLGSELSSWWPSIADHLWQSTLFALILLAASLVLRRAPARRRHTLWLLVSAKFALPVAFVVYLAAQLGLDASAFSFAQIYQNGTLIQGITEPISAIANNYQVTIFATNAQRHNELYCAAAVIWLTGSLAFLSVWFTRRRKFFAALNEGRTQTHGREWQALERAGQLVGYSGKVTLVISPHQTEPAVCRVWKPVVLMPGTIAGQLDDDELEAIMLHELIHIQRRDNLIGNLQMMMCAALWFHPLVWFISAKLFDERELACDEEVLRFHGAAESYASSILKVVRFSLGWRVAGVTGAGSGSNLRRRIENIMSINHSRRITTPWHRLVAGSLVGFAFVLMAMAGVYARSYAANSLVSAIGPEAIVASNDEVFEASTPQTDRKNKEKVKPPAAPQPPPPPAPPSSPVQPAQPAPIAQPADVAATAVAPTPSAPTAASPSTPPVPAAAPVPPTKEKSKSKSKDKDKEKGDKDKVEKGGLIEAPQPGYPDEARQQSIQGTVVVTIVIDGEGHVVYAKAKSGPEALHAASEQAATKARFRPTTLNGEPVKVSGAISYNFVLDKK